MPSLALAAPCAPTILESMRQLFESLVASLLRHACPVQTVRSGGFHSLIVVRSKFPPGKVTAPALMRLTPGVVAMSTADACVVCKVAASTRTDSLSGTVPSVFHIRDSTSERLFAFLGCPVVASWHPLIDQFFRKRDTPLRRQALIRCNTGAVDYTPAEVKRVPANGQAPTIQRG